MSGTAKRLNSFPIYLLCLLVNKRGQAEDRNIYCARNNLIPLKVARLF